MTEHDRPAIPYEKQEDASSNRMCGAACLAMVYRSLAGPRAEVPRARGRDRRSGIGVSPRGKERRGGRRRSAELTQAEIWPEISRPNASGSVSSATNLMVAHARRRGYAAVAIQARYPLVALLNCRNLGVRAILNHRLRPDAGAGHFTVLVDVGPAATLLHDPFYGPDRRVPHAQLLELWQPNVPGSEITGNVLIGVAARPIAFPRCPVCGTPIPEEVACPRCAAPVSLQPKAVLGCVGDPSCLGRMWNYVCCPACDHMWSFATAPRPPQPSPAAEEGPWQLGPLLEELDTFRRRVLAVPGMASRPDVKAQLGLLDRYKLDLRLAEKEEAALARQREEQLSAMKERFGAQAAAAEKARDEAAKPAPAPDGAALGEALLKELGITR